MLTRRAALYLQCAFFLAGRARAADRPTGGVPLPADLTLHPPHPGTPGGAFAGAWIGSWDGWLRHVLVVETVRPDGTADVVSALADDPAAGIRGGWVRRHATIAGGVLSVRDPAARYVLDPAGRLSGTARPVAAIASASLIRVPQAALAGGAAGLDWGEPDLVFVDGPIENGAPVRLEVALFRPAGAGPFPLAVLNHGATATGTDPVALRRPGWPYAPARFLADAGWLVACPHRRGRGRSEGFYDETFEADRSRGYGCGIDASMKGEARALADVDAAVAALRRRPEVAPGPILIGGVSRGGALAVAYAGRHPGEVAGVLNFVGGWLGAECPTADQVNAALSRAGGRFPRPTLWLYGENDRYYSIAHSRGHFDAFRHAGGTGRFLVFHVPNGAGHGLAAFPELWAGPVREYLATIGPALRP